MHVGRFFVNVLLTIKNGPGDTHSPSQTFQEYYGPRGHILHVRKKEMFYEVFLDFGTPAKESRR